MVFKSGMFQIDPKMTPDQVANKRAMIAALLPKFGSAKYVGEGIGQLATGVMAGRQGRKLDEIESNGTASANSLWERLMGTANSAQSSDMGPLTVLGMHPDAPPKPTGPEYPLGVDELPQAPTTPGGYSMGTEVKSYIPDEVKNGIFAGESGGDYNALFGFSNRPGGKFANTRLTDMTVDEALNFASPSGEYGQTVKGQIGRVATPMGAYQIVGTTLRAAKEGLGLTGNEKMTPELQDMLGGWIYENQGTGAWAGYRGPQASFTPAAGSAAPSGYGAAAPAPTSAPSIPINELYMALQNPWLSGEQKGLITSMIQEQQQASDPLYQLQLAQAQADLAKSTAPAGPPEELVLRQALAAEAGYEKGTPEYQSIIISGKLPEAPAPVKPYSDIGQINADLSAGLITPADAEAAKAALAKGGTNVTVNNVPGTPPSDEALRKKLMEAEGVAWGEYIKAGSTASGMTQDMELLGQVIEMAPQGPISGRLAEAFPGVSDAAGVFQSVVKRIAPSLRVEGSGAQSDIEYNGFLQSLPSLSNRPEANRAIATFLKAKAAINMERGQVIQQYQNGEIDATAARTKIKEIDSRSILSPELKNLLGSMDGGAESGDMSEDDAAYLRSLGMEP